MAEFIPPTVDLTTLHARENSEMLKVLAAMMLLASAARWRAAARL